MPMFPQDDSANAADPLAALINDSFGVDAAVRSSFHRPAQIHSKSS